MPRPRRNQFPNGPNGNKAFKNAVNNYTGKRPARNNNNNLAHKALTVIAQNPNIPYVPGLAMASKHFRVATPAQKRNEARRRVPFMKHKRAVNKLINLEKKLESVRAGGAWMTHGSLFTKYYSNRNKALENILRTRRNIYHTLLPNRRFNFIALNYDPNHYFFVPLNNLGGQSINNVYRQVTGNGISRYRKPYPSFVPNY